MPAATTTDAVRALARVSRALERACGELSLAHYRVLAAIASGDERASRIAAKLTLGRPAISASVDALGQRGLLDRESVDGDQRGTALRLTAAGQSALRAAEQAMAECLDALRGDDRDVLESLVRLGKSLDAALAAKAW